MVVVAGYLFRDRETATTDALDALMQTGLRMAGGSSWVGVYGDGFTDITGGWEKLMNDVQRLAVTHIVTPNLTRWENNYQNFLTEVTPLIEHGIVLVVPQAPMINGGHIVDRNSLGQAVVLLRSKEYYSNVRGLRISLGMKAKQQVGGRPPFGMMKVEDRFVVDPMKGKIVVEIMGCQESGISISNMVALYNNEEDSPGVDLNYHKVRSIIAYWEDKPWKTIFQALVK
jgi:hypothetical protein